MYLAYYGLNKEPFHTTPDPSFLFLSPQHKEALGAIIYGIEKRKGFIAIIGEVGVGKTTILRAYLERNAAKKHKTIYIFNPVLSYHGLLTAIFRSLDIIPRCDDVTEMVNQLHEALIKEYQAGGTVVLAIDEAQNMPMDTLENLRMISNLESSTDKLIQIILLGQPELNSMLQQPALRQFRQRIALRATISPLLEEESRAFIEHRIARASIGAPSVLFTKRALNLIVRQAQGIPRRLNILCDNALITGYGQQCKPVSVSIVKEIIKDIDSTEVVSPSIPVRWAIGVGVAVLFSLGMFFLFDSSAHNRKGEMPITVDQVDGPSSGIHSNSKAVSSGGVAQPTERRNISSLIEETSLQVLGRDGKMDVRQRDQSMEISSDQLAVEGQEVVLSEPDLPENVKVSVERNSGSSFHAESSVQKQSVDSSWLVPPNLGERESPSISGAKAMVIRTVKVGENLSQITAEVYGSDHEKYLEWVKQHNPKIVNPNLIFPGQNIVLPEYRKNKGSQ